MKNGKRRGDDTAKKEKKKCLWLGDECAIEFVGELTDAELAELEYDDVIIEMEGKIQRALDLAALQLGIKYNHVKWSADY